MTFGPWAQDLDAAERLARLRGLRAIALLLARPHVAFTAALRRAEADARALQDAAVELDRLPALTRRRVLSAYLALGRPP